MDTVAESLRFCTLNQYNKGAEAELRVHELCDGCTPGSFTSWGMSRVVLVP